MMQWSLLDVCGSHQCQLRGGLSFPLAVWTSNGTIESAKHVEHFPLTEKKYEWKERKNA